MFTDKVKKLIEESILCWLATADEKGMPSVSPKEIFCAYKNQEIIIANIASPNSVKNIRHNPNVCVSFVHVFKQKGFKIYGIATYLNKADKEYQERCALLQEMAGDKYLIQGVIKILVSSVKPILAPSYMLFPETTEKEQIENAKKTYGI
jgi:predicted pyridoxine 5'-phosphate oxidase superfamily flavin-nucleotide-binding protein